MLKKIVIGLSFVSIMFVPSIYAGCNGGDCGNLSGIINTSQSQSSVQGQGQGQGQTQGIANSGNSSVKDSGNSSVKFQNSFNGSKPIRYTPIPTDVVFGNMPSLFTSPLGNKGHNFIAAKNMIDLISQWNVMSMSDADFDVDDDVNIDITMVGKSLNDDVKVVTFYIQGSDVDKELKAKGNKPIAVGSINTDEVDVNSPELYMALVNKAKEIGANNVVLMSEGVELELVSSGWGIGASYNYASVNSDAHGQGSVGAGGTGYSKGHAKYDKKPFLTFAFVQ